MGVWALAADLIQLGSCGALNEAGTEKTQNKSEAMGLHLVGELLVREW